MALLSIMALYNYNNELFDDIKLPVDIDKDVLIPNLLMELAEFEVLYSDYNIMKMAIGFWSKKEFPIWQKLTETTKFEYNPIHNFDRTEEYTDKQVRNLKGSDNQTRALTGSNNETRNLSGSNNEIRNLKLADSELRDLEKNNTHHSETEGETENNGKDTTTEYVSAFNEKTPTLAKKNEQELGTGNTVIGSVDTTDKTSDKGTVKKDLLDTGTVNNSITDSGSVNKSLTDTGTVKNDITDTGTIEDEHKARMFGNIGVTTTQQMIEAERKVVQFNVMNFIIDSFKYRFCLLIY